MFDDCFISKLSKLMICKKSTRLVGGFPRVLPNCELREMELSLPPRLYASTSGNDIVQIARLLDGRGCNFDKRLHRILIEKVNDLYAATAAIALKRNAVVTASTAASLAHSVQLQAAEGLEYSCLRVVK